MEKVWVNFIALVTLVLSVVGNPQYFLASAPVFESNDTVVISEVTEGTLAVTGETIVIEADVNGPLFAAGQNIVVEGDVNGSIFVAGNSISIEGDIFGEVFLAGNTIQTDPQAEFRRDVFVVGNSILIGSEIGRDLFIGSNSTRIQNRIGRNGYIASDTITFNNNGRIIGDLNYRSEQEVANINEYVQGEINFQRAMQETDQRMYRRSPFSTVLGVIGAIISAMLIWLFLRGVTQKRWITVSTHLMNRPILLLFIGLGLTLLMPLLILLAFLSNLFSNLGLLLILVFLLLMFFGKIVTASVLG